MTRTEQFTEVRIKQNNPLHGEFNLSKRDVVKLIFGKLSLNQSPELFVYLF